jgi:hypothetical protein
MTEDQTEEILACRYDVTKYVARVRSTFPKLVNPTLNDLIRRALIVANNTDIPANADYRALVSECDNFIDAIKFTVKYSIDAEIAQRVIAVDYDNEDGE